MQRLTRHSHIVQQEVIMENFTSPAARIPYAGIKESTQEIGFVIVIKMTILKQRLALSASIPPKRVIGFVSASTVRQLITIAAWASQDSFLM